MSGSIRWFPYETDAGDDFAIKADESNTEAVNSGVGTPSSLFALPRNVKPRHGIYRSADGLTSRKVYFVSQDNYNSVTVGSTITVNGITLFLTRKVGEVISAAQTIDTGLTDGDNP